MTPAPQPVALPAQPPAMPTAGQPQAAPGAPGPQDQLLALIGMLMGGGMGGQAAAAPSFDGTRYGAESLEDIINQMLKGAGQQPTSSTATQGQNGQPGMASLFGQPAGVGNYAATTGGPDTSAYQRSNITFSGDPSDPTSNSPYTPDFSAQLGALEHSWSNPGIIGADTPGLGPFNGAYGFGGYTRGTSTDPTQNPQVGNNTLFGEDPNMSMNQYSQNSMINGLGGNPTNEISSDMMNMIMGGGPVGGMDPGTMSA